MNKHKQNIHIWVQNDRSEYLICRRCESGRVYWQPLCCNTRDEESVMETIVRETREAVGLTLTPSLGKVLGVEDGDDGIMSQLWEFAYMNAELDPFVYSKPEIQTAIWADRVMIRELYSTGCFDVPDQFYNLETFIGEMKPYDTMSRLEMTVSIGGCQRITSKALKLNLHPESDLLASRHLENVFKWSSLWNLEGQEVDYQLFLAYSNKIAAELLAKDYAQAEKHCYCELQILERNRHEPPDYRLIGRIAGVHGLLELICHETGQVERELQEKNLRTELRKQEKKLFEEEVKQWRPDIKRWSENRDESVFDDDCIFRMREEEPNLISLEHIHWKDTSMTEMTISDYRWNLQYGHISDSVFNELSRLKSVKIDSATLRLDGNPWAGCEQLEKITVTPENKYLIMQKNILLSADKKRVIAYLPAVPDKIVRVPEGVVIIGKNAFCGAKHLVRIILPPSVKKIEEGAFYNCVRLKEINLPGELETISNWMFGNCYALERLIIPSSVSVIGECAFMECRSLRGIALPRSLKVLDSLAFAFAENLQEVRLPESLDFTGYNVFADTPFLLNHPQFREDNE